MSIKGRAKRSIKRFYKRDWRGRFATTGSAKRAAPKKRGQRKTSLNRRVNRQLTKHRVAIPVIAGTLIGLGAHRAIAGKHQAPTRLR